MFGHFPGSRVSVRVVVAPEDKRKTNECPPLPPPPPRFYTEQTSYGMEYPFGQFGSAVLAMSPPKILPTPSLLGGGGNVGETALMLWEHCFNSSQNTGVLSTLF